MIKETTIHPHSTFYRVWEAVVVVTVLIVTFFHPYNACFPALYTGNIVLKCRTEISWSGLRRSAQPDRDRHRLVYNWSISVPYFSIKRLRYEGISLLLWINTVKLLGLVVQCSCWLAWQYNAVASLGGGEERGGPPLVTPSRGVTPKWKNVAKFQERSRNNVGRDRDGWEWWRDDR